MQKAMNIEDLIEKMHQQKIALPEKYPFRCPVEGCGGILIYTQTAFLSHLFNDGGHKIPFNDALRIVEIYNPIQNMTKGDE